MPTEQRLPPRRDPVLANVKTTVNGDDLVDARWSRSPSAWE
jgi:hypothetical protein